MAKGKSPGGRSPLELVNKSLSGAVVLYRELICLESWLTWEKKTRLESVTYVSGSDTEKLELAEGIEPPTL